jgi:hypothetical protein
MNKLSRLALLCALLAGWAAAGAEAPSYCSSDGQPRPTALMERFINADCESCWSDTQTPQPRQNELALDWILPGSRGDDAPLSAAASGDGLARLEALRRTVPQRADTLHRKVQPDRHALRVVNGLPFNDYIAASIELKPGRGSPWHAWLLLVETIPAGADGTPVERNLVRNTFQPLWDDAKPLSKEEQHRLFELRPMRIPEGATGTRLRVVGWVEDARGRIVVAAQSRCIPTH